MDTNTHRGNLPDRRGTGSLKWDLARPGEIPLWVADMDFPVAPAITAALSRRLAHPIFGYTGVPRSYREAFCAWQSSRNGWEISPEQLVILPGVMPAVSLLVENYTRPGEGVALFSPVYYPFFEVVEELGRRVERIPLAVENGGGGGDDAVDGAGHDPGHDAAAQAQGPRHGIDEDALDEALARSRMLLLCSPHNPGGRVWTVEELSLIARAAERHRVMVVSDEIHSDLLFPGETFVPWLTLERAGSGHGGHGGHCRDVALLAPSKTFNIPGLPTALAVVPDEHHRRDLERVLHARKQYMSSILAITAAEAAYTGAASWLDETCATLYRNYLLVRDALAGEKAAVYRMEGTFIAWIDFRACPGWEEPAGSSERFDETARAQGVWLSRGRQFGPQGEGHMRLNFATSPELLREGMVRLRGALAAFATGRRG